MTANLTLFVNGGFNTDFQFTSKTSHTERGKITSIKIIH